MCVAGFVTLTVTGWPSIVDSVRARVVQTAVQPERVDLTLERVESSILGDASGRQASFSFPQKPGTELARVVLKEGVPIQLHRAKGVAHYTNAVLRAVED